MNTCIQILLNLQQIYYKMRICQRLDITSFSIKHSQLKVSNLYWNKWISYKLSWDKVLACGSTWQYYNVAIKCIKWYFRRCYIKTQKRSVWSKNSDWNLSKVSGSCVENRAWSRTHLNFKTRNPGRIKGRQMVENHSTSWVYTMRGNGSTV